MMKFDTARIHFSRNVFAVLAVVVALIYPQIQRQDDHCSQDFDCDCLFSKQ